jgi:hypothetical protein
MALFLLQCVNHNNRKDDAVHAIHKDIEYLRNSANPSAIQRFQKNTNPPSPGVR